MAEVIPFREQPNEKEAIVRARIPRRFWNARLSEYRCHTPSQSAALKAVGKWRDSTEGLMLALIGKTGTGKSHLLYAVARDLFEVGRGIYVRPWYVLVNQLRWGVPIATEAGGRTREPAEVRMDWWSAPTVMLDEVRRTSTTDFDADELAKFSCHAYDQCMNVLITTNTPLEELMGAAAASRYAQVEIDGPDGRA